MQHTPPSHDPNLPALFLPSHLPQFLGLLASVVGSLRENGPGGGGSALLAAAERVPGFPALCLSALGDSALVSQPEARLLAATSLLNACRREWGSTGGGGAAHACVPPAWHGALLEHALPCCPLLPLQQQLLQWLQPRPPPPPCPCPSPPSRTPRP